LVGTFNKMLEYSREVFADVFSLFRFLLRGCDRLVVSGHSFGDKGINGQIVQWLEGGRTRRMIVVHPDEKGLLGRARGAIRNNWDDWRKLGKVRVVALKIENVSWKDIRSALATE